MKKLLNDKRVIAGVVFVTSIILSATLFKKGLDETAKLANEMADES